MQKLHYIFFSSLRGDKGETGALKNVWHLTSQVEHVKQIM